MRRSLTKQYVKTKKDEKESILTWTSKSTTFTFLYIYHYISKCQKIWEAATDLFFSWNPNIYKFRFFKKNWLSRLGAVKICKLSMSAYWGILGKTVVGSGMGGKKQWTGEDGLRGGRGNSIRKGEGEAVEGSGGEERDKNEWETVVGMERRRRVRRGRGIQVYRWRERQVEREDKGKGRQREEKDKVAGFRGERGRVDWWRIRTGREREKLEDNLL